MNEIKGLKELVELVESKLNEQKPEEQIKKIHEMIANGNYTKEQLLEIKKEIQTIKENSKKTSADEIEGELKKIKEEVEGGNLSEDELKEIQEKLVEMKKEGK